MATDCHEQLSTLSIIADSGPKQMLLAMLKANKTAIGVEVTAWGAVQNWRTWYLALINLCDSTVKYAIIYWCPLIIYHMVGDSMPHTAAGIPRSND